MKKRLLTFLLLSQIFSQSSNAAFDEVNFRYMAPNDFYAKLVLLFTNADNYYCVENIGGEISTYGASNPITGLPKSTSPDGNLITSYYNCANQIINSEIQNYANMQDESGVESDLSSRASLGKDTYRRIFEPLVKKIKYQYPEAIGNESVNFLKPEDLKFHTVHLIQYMLGPDDVIKGYGEVSGADELADILIKKLKTNSTNIGNYTSRVLSALVIRDEFLMF